MNNLLSYFLKLLKKEEVAKFILSRLFEDVRRIKENLFLDFEEILSTLILLVYDQTDNSAFVNVSGDGFIVCNSIVKEVDQQNLPDYLGYHLDLKFDQWYKNHTESLSYNNVEDISIATDGIARLKANPLGHDPEIDPLNLFLLHPPKGNPEQTFYREYKKLIDVEKFIPHDDISILRIIP